MPTAIILDTSLSMLRPTDPSSEATYKDVAVRGISYLLDHLEAHFRLEYAALLIYSSLAEKLVGFTRDLRQIRERLRSSENYDTGRLSSAITGLCCLVQEEWGSASPVDAILVTDGTLGRENLTISKPPVSLKGTLDIICLSPISQRVRDYYESVIRTLEVSGNVYSDDPQRVFAAFMQDRYRPYRGTLKFGDSLSCPVSLNPPPQSPYKITGDFETLTRTVSDTLEILGFFTLGDVASPPVVSKHLVLSALESGEDSRNTPSLIVFLHGAFKVVSMCALVKISDDDWYGLLFSCSDSKKKSSLMISLFQPGTRPVPWLGDLKEIGPLSDLNATSQDPFPISRRGVKPSYSSNPVVWIKNASLQSDIQKILRHARKIPDKTAHFYKDLNRLKKAAVCLGFHELLEGVALIFERECSALPSTAHPECSIQLGHAAEELKTRECLSLDYQITPLNSKFK